MPLLVVCLAVSPTPSSCVRQGQEGGRQVGRFPRRAQPSVLHAQGTSRTPRHPGGKRALRAAPGENSSSQPVFARPVRPGVLCFFFIRMG